MTVEDWEGDLAWWRECVHKYERELDIAQRERNDAAAWQLVDVLRLSRSMVERTEEEWAKAVARVDDA